MHKQSRNKFIRKHQFAVANLWQETDTCAAIDGARMSSSDRQQVKNLCDQILTILDKY